MAATYRVRILHLSDLHARVAVAGTSPERRNLIKVQKPARERVLGAALERELDRIAATAPVDLVCFTGDVADWGLEAEYSQASATFARILQRLHLGPDRLFVIPGNHDVNQSVNKDAWQSLRELSAQRSDVARGLGYWAARSKVPHSVDKGLLGAVLSRQAAFWNWVDAGLGRGGLVPGSAESNHPTLGYRATLRLDGLPFPIHVVGLNSAWLSGDDHDKGKLLVTREQVHWLLHSEQGALPGLRVALMHHALGDLADWDAGEVRVSLAESADLLLHGHRHEPDLHAHLDPDQALTVIAAGCVYEGDEGDRFVNGWHVIEVELDAAGRPLQFEFTFYDWAKKGHWFLSNAMSRLSVDGKLRWAPVTAAPSDQAPSPGAATGGTASREAWHPSDDLAQRGPLMPCRVRVNPHYGDDGERRWERYGDVLVTLDHPPTSDDIYLIPSRHAPRRFYDPKQLARAANREPKKRVAARWARESLGRELEGWWFSKRLASDGRERVHVYVPDFDQHLSANAKVPHRDGVYISYKSEDHIWRARVRERLDADPRLHVWDDTRLVAGTEYLQAMADALQRARVMIVLASIEYMGSPMVTRNELEPALAAARDGELTLLWLKVREFDFRSSPLANYMAAGPVGKALEAMERAQYEDAIESLYEAVCRVFGLRPKSRPRKDFVRALKDAGLT